MCVRRAVVCLAVGLLLCLLAAQTAMAAPPAPTLLWPANGDTKVVTPVDFEWAPVPGVTTYWIMVFDLTPGGPRIAASGYCAAAFLAVVPPGRRYGWVVWAHNASGWSPPSEIRWFGTTLSPFMRLGWAFVKRVVVDARATWTDTGVDLGSTNLGLFAWGRTQPTTPPHPAYPSGFGPEGAEFVAGPNRPLSPLPSAPFMALLGRIGADGEPFYVGRARNCPTDLGSGRLYLTVNDDYRSDNLGVFYVDIYRQP